ncbi:seryl-tRNA synthase-like protein [Scheffersomyces xylosifermentans]|uniref:seryl-tRNA synthase-like protein n=1 Tax=Scheffersomyces xylosifermentans TaxID=1304137 RepID=UPI00315DCA2D
MKLPTSTFHPSFSFSRTVVARRYAGTFKNSEILLKPQIDVNGIIENYSKYEESIIRRQLPQETLYDLKFIVENRPKQLEISQKMSVLKGERNKLGEQMKKERSPEIKDRLISIKSELKPLESIANELTEKIYSKAESLPNLLDETVPVDPLKNDIVHFINCTSEDDAMTKKPRTKYDHKEIGEKLKIMDFETASRISGSSWYYLIGDGALLEQALVQYALSKARKRGYKMVVPPSIVRSEIVRACGFRPQDQNNEKQIYELVDENRSLTGTAEIPLGALHSSTVFDSVTNFPIKYVGVSRSYRAEAGASGKDTKGLYRVHEFTKVELFHFTTASNGPSELEELKELQIEVITELGLSAKVLNMATSDLGAPAMKKYDIEAWMPGRGNWGELTSSSNCGDFQSRRLGIRHHNKEQKMTHIHTLNGTCMAVPRVIIALIEQNYDPETESIRIPEVLQPYMEKDSITKN